MLENDIQFRIATLEDAPQLQQLLQAAFRAEDSRYDWIGSPELATGFTMDIEDVTSMITQSESNFILAIAQGGLAGCVGVRKRSPNYARLCFLAVDPDRHRRGLGRQVLAHGEDYCRREFGADQFGLDALCTRKALILWYERQGYRKTGEITPFPDQKLNGRDRSEDVWFVEMEKRA